MRSIWFWILIVNAAVGTVGTDSYCECDSTGSGTIELIPPFGCDVFYKLDGCNGAGSSVSWPGFQNVVDVSIELKEFSTPPTVTSIFSSWHEGYVDLIWSHDGTEYNCGAGPKPISKSANKFPLQIDPSKTYFQFSNYSTFLFLNCNSAQYPNGIQTSDICESYISACNQSEKYGDCVELEYNKSSSKYPSFFESVSSWNCTHFEVIVNRTGNSWNAGTIELVWWIGNDSICSATDSCKGGNKVAIIAGTASAASLVVIILAVLVILFLLRRRRYYKRHYITQDPVSSNKEMLRNRRGLQLSSAMYEHPVQFSYKVLQSATKTFQVKLGEGAFGVVYRGTISSCGIELAVKVLDPESRHTDKQFANEVSTIGSIHHVNVVRLLGFCTQKSNRILVYEFVANGSLDRLLFNPVEPLARLLNWKQRYAIALGVARGLCYLHEECRHKIVHCDIKPHNILLDKDMNPKISDFGLSKLIARRGNGSFSVVTMAKGTPGYVAPEFWIGGESRLTTKFDVYSYGMVLFELLSGRPNFSRGCFPAEAYHASMNEQFESLLDRRLHSNEILHTDLCLIREQVRRITLVALWCVQDIAAQRPSMKEVLQLLEGSGDVPEKPPPPAILTRSELYSSVTVQQESANFDEAIQVSCGR